MKMMKRIAAIGVAALMVATLAAFTGCSADGANEKVIRDSLTEQLDAYKNHDDSVVSQIQLNNAATFAMLGIDGAEYANAVLDGFDYAIEDVTVNGKDATATLVLTQKAIDEDEAEAIMTELAADPEFAALSYDEKKGAVSDKVFEYIGSVEAAPQDPETFEFVLNGDTWEPTDESAERLKNLIELG